MLYRVIHWNMKDGVVNVSDSMEREKADALAKWLIDANEASEHFDVEEDHGGKRVYQIADKPLGADAYRLNETEVAYAFPFPHNTNAAEFLRRCMMRKVDARYSVNGEDVIVRKPRVLTCSVCERTGHLAISHSPRRHLEEGDDVWNCGVANTR